MGNENNFRIEDLIPTDSIFKLKRFGDIEFKLKPCTGGMLISMSKRIGNVEAMLTNPSGENISKMALSLMDYESAKHFKQQQVKIVDVITGEESEETIGGFAILLHSMGGIKEQYSVYGAVLESMGHDKQKVKKVIDDLIKSLSDAVQDKIEGSVKKKT